MRVCGSLSQLALLDPLGVETGVGKLWRVVPASDWEKGGIIWTTHN